MAECEDLGVLGPVTHRQKAKHRERVGHAEIRQSKQHEAASSPSGWWRSDAGRDVDRSKIFAFVIEVAVTWVDEVLGTRRVPNVPVSSGIYARFRL